MPLSDVPVGAVAPIPSRSLRLTHVSCGICGSDDPEPVAVGEDFEYRTSDDTFLMVRCRPCGLLYLNPRPADHQAERIYPAGYRERQLRPALGYAARIHRRSEMRRLLRSCHGLPRRARILDVGCGDGFRLARLRAFAPDRYRLEGIEPDGKAVAAARADGLTVHQGTLADVTLEAASYDLALAVRALEYSSDPAALLARIRLLLRPGGRLIVVTDNADSFGRRIFGDRYWGGYRFPRIWNLFTQATLARLAASSGFHVKSSATRTSPFGWIDSIRNALLDARAPAWLVGQFGPSAPLSLVIFTIVDALGRFAGGSSELHMELERPTC